MNELLSRYLDDQLVSGEIEQLAAWLREDKANLRQFVTSTFDDRALYDMLGHDNRQGDATDTCTDNEVVPDRLVQRVFSPVIEFINREPVISMIVAALVVWIVLGTLALMTLPEEEHIAAEDGPETSTAFVAVVAGESAPVWAAANDKLSIGTALQSGQRLELSSGFVRIEFYDGATALVQGPAVLRIEGTNRGFLESGRLVGQVPPEARGFTVATAVAEIVDLGTEFGIDARPRHATVEVFEGEVAVTRPAAGEPSGLAKPHRLTAGNTLRITQDGKLTRLPSHQARFVRTIAQASRELLVYEPFGAANHIDVAGQSGGYGFADMPWSGEPNIRCWTRANQLEYPSNVPFPTRLGHLEYATNTYHAIILRRPLSTESSIRLGEDGVYYLSFLARKFNHDSLGMLGLLNQAKHDGLHVGWSYSGGVEQPDPFALEVLGSKQSAGAMPNHAHQFFVLKLVALKSGKDQLMVKVYDSAHDTVHDDPESLAGVGPDTNQWTWAAEFDSDSILDELTLRCDGPSAFVQFDEIRMGTTWQAVTGR